MIICDDGDLYGSIGGGVMEFNIVQMAKKSFGAIQEVMLINQVHGGEEHKDSSGMICSGSQMISLFPLDNNDSGTVEKIINSGSGTLICGPRGISFDSDIIGKEETLFHNDQDWSYHEHIGISDHLYIFGGGHVSLALSKLFHDLDFHIQILDDRNMDLSTIKNNSFADEILLIDYKNAAQYIPEGDHIYVVIMTTGHRSDGLILEKLIHKKIKYLGMMGSPKKVKSVYNDLISKGISDSELKKVDAPIGIPINSDTPMEIAVSIAAKVIDLKNSKHRIHN